MGGKAFCSPQITPQKINTPALQIDSPAFTRQGDGEWHDESSCIIQDEK